MILQSFKMACKAIFSNRMRSFLTMLGIIIGVTSLVVLVSLVKGATDSVTEGIAEAGKTMLSVTVNDNRGVPLTLPEIRKLADREWVAEAAPFASETLAARYKEEKGDISVIGTTPGYFQIQNLKTEKGRSLKMADVENASYVIVLNNRAAEKLFHTTEAAGKEILLGGRRFLVAGVLEDKDKGGWNMEQMEGYIPFTTMSGISSNAKYVSTFSVTAAESEKSKETEEKLTSWLLQRFKGNKKSFQISNSAEFIKLMESTQKTMMLMLGGIAGISLLVGGIGIMNIMLVSVTERTREIGIRKAIGASYGNIMMQFLVESLVISLIGCAIGIFLSWGIVKAADSLMAGYTYRLSAGALWAAVSFSAAIGMIFGSYPANRAAKKKPIEALRTT